MILQTKRSVDVSPPTSECGLAQQTYLPELLRGVLASDALEDLGAAGVLVDEVGDVVDAVVDDDVHALVGRVVGRDFGLGDRFGHCLVGWGSGRRVVGVGRGPAVGCGGCCLVEAIPRPRMIGGERTRERSLRW